MVRRSQLRWLALWLVVWVLSVAFTENDPNNYEAGVFVVPMVMTHGPRVFYLVSKLPRDLIAKGADPAVATAALRAGTLPSVILGFAGLAGVVLTFRG